MIDFKEVKMRKLLNSRLVLGCCWFCWMAVHLPNRKWLKVRLPKGRVIQGCNNFMSLVTGTEAILLALHPRPLLSVRYPSRLGTLHPIKLTGLLACPLRIRSLVYRVSGLGGGRTRLSQPLRALVVNDNNYCSFIIRWASIKERETSDCVDGARKSSSLYEADDDDGGSNCGS